MSKRFIVCVVFILAAAFAAGFAITKYVIGYDHNPSNVSQMPISGSGTSDSDGGAGSSSQNAQPGTDTDPVMEQVKNMTLDEKIGQMLMLGIDGYSLDADSRKLIVQYHAGGIVLLERNVQNVQQLLNLTNSIKSANSSNKIPLFISVDEEGGRVDRMPGNIERYPTNKEIGTLNNRNLSYNIGKSLADEIKAFGFNMDLAPVLDINSNPKNPVIGDRSFGTTPDIVTALGTQTMLGIQSENIIPVVKHFPGHGDTSVDSHLGLPIVYNDMNRLESFELLPFKEAIKSGADAVMVAHILLPKIDAENPASFSKTIITGVLRNQLGFNGVVITDDMTMGAIIKNYNIGEAAVKSIKAGTDIILVCNGQSNKLSVINSIKAAAVSGDIPESRIDESVYRILKLKQKYNLSDTPVQSVDVDKINNEIESVLKGSK